MNGIARYVRLKAQEKTGVSAAVGGWAVLGALCALATLAFLIFAMFIWLAERYGSLSGALIVAGVLFLLAVLAGILCLVAQRRNVEAAKRALQAQSATRLFDPRFLSVGVQLGRAIGWQKLVSLGAVGILAAGLAWEWSGRSHENT